MDSAGPHAAHSGILTAAAAIYKDLEQHNALGMLLGGAASPSTTQKSGQFPDGPSNVKASKVDNTSANNNTMDTGSGEEITIKDMLEK